MNREQARREIDSLDYYLQNHTDDYGEESHTAMMMAIKALEQQPDAIHNEREQAYMKGYEDASKRFRAEPCEDAISRQAAIDYLMDNMTWYGEDGYETDEDEKRDNIESLINAIPSVTPQQRWIPVSEKLPKINQRVLVTSYGRVCYAMMISADGNSGYPIFKLQDSLNERVICETTVHSKFTTSRITAWMPLPQPYKVESEDGESNA